MQLLKVTSEIRTVRYFKRNHPIDKDKITGSGMRSFLDITTTTKLYSGRKEKEVFTAHIFKGELRVIVQPAGRRDERQSMSEDDFTKYVTRRWPENGIEVLFHLSNIKE